VLAVLAMLLAMDLLVLGSARDMVQASRQLGRREQAVTVVQSLTSTMLEMQSGMRGYLLTGEDAFQARYRGAAELPGSVQRRSNMPATTKPSAPASRRRHGSRRNGSTAICHRWSSSAVRAATTAAA
jgi:CHASE3 domain sensor protein